jgi:hypothetical protein
MTKEVWPEEMTTVPRALVPVVLTALAVSASIAYAYDLFSL